MKKSEAPPTDSGYPTPRDDIPSTSRSGSPLDSSPDENSENKLTSTPIRGNISRSRREHFTKFQPELSIIDSTASDSITVENDSNYVLGIVPQHYYQISFPSDGVKSILSASKELKKRARENVLLRDENESLRGENESLREENCSLREESRRIDMDRSMAGGNVIPVIPKLKLNDEDMDSTASSHQLKSSEKIKKELLSFIKNEDERTMIEAKMENMMISDCKPPVKVFTATATIQVDTDKIDADVQTETDDHVNVVNANLQIELDQLQSEIEVIGKKKSDLETRLFDYEQTKAKFEKDEQKLRADLEKKLKSSQEQLKRFEMKIEELQARLNKKRKEFDEVEAENRRLLDDKNTHEFELDEMKVHGEHIAKQNEDLEENMKKMQMKIDELEKAIEEEKDMKQQLEKKIEEMAKNHKSLIEKLDEDVESAWRKETEALEKLELVQSENKSLQKENEYLKQAQQVLLDSELNLKSEVDVLTANFRNCEAQLTQKKDQIVEEKRRGENLEAEIGQLEAQNRKLLDEKHDSNELLEELKKGKLEIDHLRQQVQHLSRESEEMVQLKNELSETVNREKLADEKLEKALKKEGELEAKLEGYIRSESAAKTELERLKEDDTVLRSNLETALQAAQEKASALATIERAYDELRVEFEEFRGHANAQYESDIFVRDQQIEHLRVRLLELETYPGQTISVSRRNQEVQTEGEEPQPVVSYVQQSPEVSLVSEDLIPAHLIRLEEKIKNTVEGLKQVVQEQQVDDMSGDLQASPLHYASETFKKFAELLNSLLANSEDYESDSQKIKKLWKALNKNIVDVTTTLEERFEFVRSEMTRKNHRNEQKLRDDIEELRKDLGQERALAEQRVYIAKQFKEQYELEEREKEELREEYERLVELRNEDNAESERNERSLRERLERAEHIVQKHARDKLNRTYELEADVEELTNSLKRKEEEYRRKIAEMEEDVQVFKKEEKKKRAYERLTAEKMIKAYNIVKDRHDYLLRRNKERQKLLDDIMKAMRSKDGNQLRQITDNANKSGLLNLDDQESVSLTTERRVLSESNVNH
ncbi:hypothetical protein L5515_003700 [Caenorhabditis briggsae]|uniref:Uncharacterized protein n=1 Tax=Caenorhabditis briggsae TaxID=6238 RepID=A0AAE9EK19_CAEBR|nr:hypothetical protein L5515_003700 [Caenorhabditis briggsae]